MKEPKVGETYYCVFFDDRKSPENVVVTKLGRKYFYCDYLKVNKDTFIDDNGEYSSTCQLYDSKEQYEYKLKADMCWSLVRDRLSVKMTNEEKIELYEKLKNR